MKYWGFHITQDRSNHLSTQNSYPFSTTALKPTLALRAGLTALLLVSSSSILLTSQANTGETSSQRNTLSLIAQVPTSATVIYVNPETGVDTSGVGTSANAPYKTITFALRQAQPGTIIQLAPGNYNNESGETFPLILNPGISLRGDESSKGQAILITGGGAYVSRTFAGQNITILANDNTTVAGLTVANPNQRGTGVWVESGRPTIKNNTFTNSNREGIFVTGTSNPQVENNLFVQNQGNGISIASTAQGEIRNNIFQDTGFGLAIGGNSTPLVEGNQIIQNQDGLFISQLARPVLRKNVIQNNQRDGIVATVNAQPDLGTNENPGGNLIRDNQRHDVNNVTSNTIIAIGNDIDQSRISGSVNFVAATVDLPTGQTAFRDVPAGYWAKAYIEALAAKNIIAGFPDGTFKPNEPVTRAQFATIVTKALNPPMKRANINFRDVASNFWAYGAIQSAYRSQFLAGYPDGTFQPQQQIPRVQALVSLANGLGLTANDQNVLSFYSDAAQIPNYAISPVAAATARQLVINYPSARQLNPNRPATRAEIAAFIYQALVNAGRVEAIPSPYLVTAQ
jgi:parallel beta-helix repeat protein